MTAPSPPPASFGAMQTRAGYADGSPALTAEQLDAAMALTVQTDAPGGNTQQLQSVRVGNNWITAAGGAIYATSNAYLSGGAWYTVDQSQAAYALMISPQGLSLLYTTPTGGAIVWQQSIAMATGGVPVATTESRGTVMVDGQTIAIDGQGRISAQAASTTQAGIVKYDGATIQPNGTGQLTAVMPAASPTTAGLVKYDGATIQRNAAGQLVAAGGAISIDGVWNAATNSPALASGVGIQGHGYAVQVAGATNLDGAASWNVGDQAIYLGGAWHRFAVTPGAVVSVNGQTGAITLTAGGIAWTHGGGGVSRTVDAKLQETPLSILDLGGAADTGSHFDNVPAMLTVAGTGAHIHFPGLPGTVYWWGNVTTGALAGLHISTAPGVKLAIDGTSIFELGGMIFESDITYTDVGINVASVNIAQSLPVATKASVRRASMANLVPDRLIALDMTQAGSYYAISWPNIGTPTPITPAAVTTSSVSLATINGQFAVAAVPIGVGETLSATFAGQALGSSHIAVVVRYATGIVHVSRAVDAIGTPLYVGVGGFGTTGTHLQDLPYSNLGGSGSAIAYTSYEPGQSVISITRTARDGFMVQHNGKAVTEPTITDPGLGDIVEVGFGVYGQYGPTTVTMTGWTISIQAILYGSNDIGQLCFFGDSQSAPTFANSWPSQMRQILDNEFGFSAGLTITNLAVSGTTIAQIFAAVQAADLGNAHFVFVTAVTNDIQEGTPLSQVETDARALVTYVQSTKGRQLVWDLPWIWYGQAQSGGTGQGSSNYDQGAPYRMLIERICAEMGVLLVHMPRLLANPDPSLLGTGLPTGVEDNIHTDARNRQRLAEENARIVAASIVAFPRGWETDISQSITLAGATVNGLTAQVSDNGGVVINGDIVFATPPTANGTVIGTLPRFLWPTSLFNVNALILTASGVGTITGHAIIAFATNGQILFSTSSGVSCTRITMNAPYIRSGF